MQVDGEVRPIGIDGEVRLRVDHNEGRHGELGPHAPCLDLLRQPHATDRRIDQPRVAVTAHALAAQRKLLARRRRGQTPPRLQCFGHGLRGQQQGDAFREVAGHAVQEYVCGGRSAQRSACLQRRAV